MYNERATLDRFACLLFTLDLCSGLRPSVWGKVTSDNWNLETYVTTKEICHVMLALIKSESVPTSNYPSKTVETTFLGQFCICLLF